MTKQFGDRGKEKRPFNKKKPLADAGSGNGGYLQRRFGSEAEFSVNNLE